MLREDIERIAGEAGHEVRRIRFREPEELSAVVADLYRRWYVRHGIEPTRLVIESFILLDPLWALRSGHVPFWAVFNTQESLRSVRDYLTGTDAFEEIRMMLFSHGIESLGYAPIADWKTVLSAATRIGSLVGVDEHAYPRDFATFARYSRDLEAVGGGGFSPPPLSIEDMEKYIESNRTS